MISVSVLWNLAAIWEIVTLASRSKVIATIIGVAIGLTRDNFLLGAGIGIAVGVLMSIAKTVYVERKRRQR